MPLQSNQLSLHTRHLQLAKIFPRHCGQNERGMSLQTADVLTANTSSLFLQTRQVSGIASANSAGCSLQTQQVVVAHPGIFVLFSMLRCRTTNIAHRGRYTIGVGGCRRVGWYRFAGPRRHRNTTAGEFRSCARACCLAWARMFGTKPTQRMQLGPCFYFSCSQ